MVLPGAPRLYRLNMYVCVNCFDEPGLVSFIESKAVERECYFCGTVGSRPIAAHIDDVSEHFLRCLSEEFDDANNLLGWEGDFIGQNWHTYDLLFDVLGLEFPQGNQDKLLPELMGSRIDQRWCDASGYSLNDQEVARYSWERFCRVTKQERRFFFMDLTRYSYDADVYSPAEVLSTIFDYASDISLFQIAPSGTQLFRARWEDTGCCYRTAAELGPPPPDKAVQSNRMSPAGIPMFYAGDEAETALKETASEPGRFAIGRFETTRDAVVLDLTAIPELPSLFEPVSEDAGTPPRKILKFLSFIASQISRPIERDDRVHVEYVPTQVITEFVRSRPLPDGRLVDGIRYRSSVRPGYTSYVLFATQNDLLLEESLEPSQSQWLRLADVEHRWVRDCARSKLQSPKARLRELISRALKYWSHGPLIVSW